MNYKRMAEDLVSAGYGDYYDSPHAGEGMVIYWGDKDDWGDPLNESVAPFADTAEGHRQLSVLCQYHDVEAFRDSEQLWCVNDAYSSDDYPLPDPLATYKAQMDVIRRVYE